MFHKALHREVRLPWEEVQTIQWLKEKTYIAPQNTTQKSQIAVGRSTDNTMAKRKDIH